MKPTEILMNEHRVIEQVLSCLEKMAAECEKNGRLDPAPARDALVFFRNFADRCHHGKEENQLFPMMERRGFAPHAGPTAIMRSEHEQGRELLGRIDAAIDSAAGGLPEAARLFVDSARGYANLLRAHIEKEDHCLFPMAEQSLSAADQGALLERFEHVEHEEIGEGLHESCLRIADELARRYEVDRTCTRACPCCTASSKSS